MVTVNSRGNSVQSRSIYSRGQVHIRGKCIPGVTVPNRDQCIVVVTVPNHDQCIVMVTVNSGGHNAQLWSQCTVTMYSHILPLSPENSSEDIAVGLSATSTLVTWWVGGSASSGYSRNMGMDLLLQIITYMRGNESTLTLKVHCVQLKLYKLHNG